MADTGARILVVDDEKQIRRVLETALPSHGYDVASAASGFGRVEPGGDISSRPDRAGT